VFDDCFVYLFLFWFDWVDDVLVKVMVFVCYTGAVDVDG